MGYTFCGSRVVTVKSAYKHSVRRIENWETIEKPQVNGTRQGPPVQNRGCLFEIEQWKPQISPLFN
jgi:hypothetical protein